MMIRRVCLPPIQTAQDWKYLEFQIMAEFWVLSIQGGIWSMKPKSKEEICVRETSVCMYSLVCAQMFVHTWKPEDNLCVVLQAKSTLVLKTGSLIGLGLAGRWG